MLIEALLSFILLRTGVKTGRTENRPQSGSEDPDCRLIALFGCDLAILPGNPADLASNLHGLPAVEGAGHVLKRRARRYSGDAAVAGAVARADIDLPPRRT